MNVQGHSFKDIVKSHDPATGADVDEPVPATGFVCAGDLTAEMMLSSGLHDRLRGCFSVTGVVWRKASVEPIAGLVSDGTPVYNFTVAWTHTYFVGSLNGGTWVHNDCD